MMNLITNESASALSNDDKSLIILGVDHGYGNIKTANFASTRAWINMRPGQTSPVTY